MAGRELPQMEVVHLADLLGRAIAQPISAGAIPSGALEQHAHRFALERVARSKHQHRDDQRRDRIRSIEPGEDDHDAGDERADERTDR